MHRINFRIVLLLSLLIIAAGMNDWATGSCSSGVVKKYGVTFGDSYHNYLPGDFLRIGVVFKNNSSDSVKVSQELTALDSAGVRIWGTVINLDLLPNKGITVPLMVPVPKFQGAFNLTIADTANETGAVSALFNFNVIQPKKSARLSKILVHTPDWEEGLNKFLKFWDIKAPTMSWGQVLLLGKRGCARFAAGDQEVTQLVDRALKREMSVIFLDFGPLDESQLPKISLPYDVTVSFIKAKSPEQSFVLKSDYKELIFDLTNHVMQSWNGFYGVVVPATDLRFEGKDVKINAYATTGENPYRFPVVEIIPLTGKGKLYLSQVITEQRLDESSKPPRNQPALAAYDPMAVQFLLNLISSTVGDNLLK
jgi:hypothetical protein